MASANVEARAAEIFAAGAQIRAEQADQQVAHRPEHLRPFYRATTLRYLEAYDRTFARQKACAEAKAAPAMPGVDKMLAKIVSGRRAA